MMKGEKIMEEMERTISKITEGSKELVPPITSIREGRPDRLLFHHNETHKLHRVTEHPAPER